MSSPIPPPPTASSVDHPHSSHHSSSSSPFPLLGLVDNNAGEHIPGSNGGAKEESQQLQQQQQHPPQSQHSAEAGSNNNIDTLEENVKKLCEILFPGVPPNEAFLYWKPFHKTNKKKKKFSMLGRILKPWKWKRKRIPNEHYESKLASNRVYLAGKTSL